MKNQIEFLVDFAKKDFQVLKKWTNTKVLSEQEAIANLKDLIAYHVQKMLENDYNTLIKLLYSTDIDEKQIRALFSPESSSKDIAKNIAELYINRMIQKWKTRVEYSSKDIIGDWD